MRNETRFFSAKHDDDGDDVMRNSQTTKHEIKGFFSAAAEEFV